MKSELKAKFLNHLLSKKKDQGFTLIELLVVIIIIGILSAIALPSFLNQANKGKQSEAKQYVGTLNRTQQAYYLENSAFTANLSDLANPIPAATKNYTYTSLPKPDNTNVINNGTTVAPAGGGASPLKAYAGMVAITQAAANGPSTTTAVLCETNQPGAAPVAPKPPAAVGAAPTCDTGSTPL